ncbi:phage tail protein [Pragia fontium]|uniref:P2 phage tail completion protein R (GpR) n=1 Tax=Pragia fontium DSM 5563 = ATCC 49100 TaxID=1122977 RepID=A0AAJ5BGM1_9GAMM|nr:phage tail protein [Pragia fontium]SFC49584.1 P2 phage tail completion protein R (GpR) [Pragia fontium DSM 5563 = ATCC 49100]
MSQLDSLVGFIKQNVPKRYMNEFDSWMDEPVLKRAQKAVGLNQRRLGVLVYNGTLSWGRFPYREFDPQIIFALILVWLSANSLDEQFQPEEPTIDLEVSDDKTADLTIQVGLVDEINVKPDEKGQIPIKGEKYAICSPIIWTAEEISLVKGAALRESVNDSR